LGLSFNTNFGKDKNVQDISVCKADTLKATEANRRGGPGTREKVRSRRINLEGNTHAQEINASQLPVKLSLSQLAKTLVPSYYCLYSLFNKIRDKGKIVSAGSFKR
jgi:hypothetical protein